MGDEIKSTGAAFAIMEAGEELEWRGPTGDWLRQRVRDGRLEYSGKSGNWSSDGESYDDFAKGTWRRVPTVPRVSELAGKWRERYPVVGHDFADQLEQALREGEWVDLKGVTGRDLASTYLKSTLVDEGLDAVLDHLRKRAAK